MGLMSDKTSLALGITTALRGAGGGGGGSARQPIESPDSLRSIAYARIVDLVSEGEIYGFSDQANPLSCVFLNETPVANSDSTLNFRNVQIDSRVGTQTQDPLPNFDGVESELGVGVELRQETPWTRAITNLDLDSVRVRLSTPQMSNTNTTNGDITGTRVNYKIELQTDGGSFVTKLTGAFSGKTSTKYERSHRIELPPATTGWLLRVTRLTANSESAALQNSTFIESIAEIIEAKLRMPMSALVSLIVDAEQFNNIPSRAYRLKGRIIRVPSNYDPDTREYTGVWDGTFQSRWSNNPAWVFYDMALNSRYGLGHLVPNELVDKWTLYRIAQYCDVLVDDGKGGQEPRFTCNLVLQSQADALKVMQDLATVFRGAIYATGGSVTAVGDMPEDPVYTYTPANVVDGKFTYSGSDRKVRHTVALVSWSDLSDFGRAKVEYVADDDAIARYGVQQTEVIAIGCTSRGQARRWGRYLLATERFETDAVAFDVGLDGTVVAPGKVVNIADPLRAGERRGGRIASAGVNSVTVDMMSVSAEVGDTLVVTLPSGVAERREIAAILGNIISVTPDFSAIPVAQSVWAIDSDGIPLQPYRIVAVSEGKGTSALGFTLHGIQHQPGKFAYADTGVMFDLPGIPDIPKGAVPAPTGLTVTHRDVVDQNTAVKIVNLSWDAVFVANSYNVLWRQSDGQWIDLGTTGFTNIDIAGILPGGFEVQVMAINVAGVRSVPAFGGPYDIPSVGTPPGYVEDITTGLEVLEQIGLDNQADIAQEIIDRLAGDAATALQAATDLATEATTRAADDLAVAAAAADALLNAQTDLEAAITTESTIRQSQDESLASQIATISAGTGEQFDSANIWYFDTSVDGWTGTSLSVVSGYLTIGSAASPYAQSPTLVAPFDSTMYQYVKTRIKKFGTLTWLGRLQWITASDATWDGTKQYDVSEPVFDVNDIATVDFKDVPWPANVTAIRLSLFSGPTTAGVDYYAFDWIAVGRPSPGASAAALQTETTARITADAAEVTARQTLATQMRGAYTGTDVASLTTGLVYSERQARVTADSAMASDITALEVRMDDAELDISSTASAVTALDTRVDSVEGVNTAQASAITSLDSRMTSAEGVNTSQAGALTSLDSRVTAAEGVNTAQASSITSLNSRMTSAEGVNTSQATAISGLTTRITDAEGDIDAQANDITSLQAGLGNIGGDNLLKNAGFEVNTTGTGLSDDWALSASSVTAVSYSNPASDLAGSTVSQRIQASVINGSYLGVSQLVTGIEVGQAYSLSARVKASATGNPGTPTTQIIIQWRDASNAVVSPTAYSTVVSNVGGTWKSLKLENVVAPAGADRCQVYVRTSTTMTATLQMWMDNVSFQKGAVATNFAPGVSDTANALQSLTVRVTAAEGDITSTSTALTALTATVGTKANASAVTALEARVTAVEGVNTSQASSITSLTASVNGANASITELSQVVASASVGNALPNPSFENNLDQWTMTTAQASLRTDPANARTGTRMLNIVGHATAGLRGTATSDAYIPVKAGQIVKLGFYAGAYGAAIAPVGAYLRYDVRWYDTNKAQLSSGGYVATNCTTAAPTVRWTQVSGSITVPADAVYMRVVVITNATSGNWVVDDLTVEPLTDIAANSFATSGVTLDVNGYVTGYRQINDGSTGIFSIVADKFQIVSPGGGARTEFSSGNWRVYDGAGVLRVRLGIW